MIVLVVLVVLVATLWQAGGVSLFLDGFVEFDKYKTQISILILRRGALSNLVASRWCLTIFRWLC